MHLEDKFKNFPEWDGDKWSGEGIKRLKAYKSDLKIDELNKLRDEFWASRYKKSLIWKHIRHACLLDIGKLIALLLYFILL